MTFTQTRLFGPRAAVTSDTDGVTGRYLVPTGTKTIVKQILFCNTSTTPSSVTAAIGPTSTIANRILSNLFIDGNETISFNCSVVLTAGEKLFIVSDTSTVVVTVNGIEET